MSATSVTAGEGLLLLSEAVAALADESLDPRRNTATRLAAVGLAGELLAELRLPDPRDVAYSDGTAWVADAATGVVVVELVTPPGLVQRGVVRTPGRPQGIAVRNGRAYVADGDAGLTIVDVTNPEAPLVMGGIDTPGFARQVAVAGSYAAVADLHGGVRLFDVSDPQRPRNVDSFAPDGCALDVEFAGEDTLYASAAGGQLLAFVLEMEPEATPTLPATQPLPTASPRNPSAPIYIPATANG